MEFGKITRPDRVQFSLPEEPPATREYLQSVPPREGPPRLYVGTPQWGDRAFIGQIYPPGTPQRDFLSHYARHFNTIELNTTYYRAHAPTMARWAAEVGPDFRFCAKLNREISHAPRLIAAGAETQRFAEALAAFEQNAGPSWLLTPESFGAARQSELLDYLQHWPAPSRLAVELRHPTWFSGKSERPIFAQLRKLGTVAMMTDVGGRRDVLHMELTAPIAMIRFVGNRLHATDYQRLDAWVERIGDWFDRGLHELYFFMHQPEEHLNVQLAREFIPKLNSRCGTSLTVPGLEPPPEQRLLF